MNLLLPKGALILALLLPSTFPATLDFSRCFGSSGSDWVYESVNDLAVDTQGHVFVLAQVGASFTIADPARTYGSTNASQVTLVMKVAADGSLVWSTLLRGAIGYSIIFDGTGPIITGQTSDEAFPATTGVFQPSLAGRNDAFVARFDADGALVFATFFGGSDEELGLGLCLDSTGTIFVTGITFSSDLKVTPAAPQSSLGGEQDAFVLRINNMGTEKLLATYLGGPGGELGADIAATGSGDIIVTGRSNSDQFATGPAARRVGPGGLSDVFVTRMAHESGAIRWLELIGGEGVDTPGSMLLDQSGNVFISGETSSANFPATAGAFQTALLGPRDNFVMKLSAQTGDPVFISYVGGTEMESSGISLYLNNDNPQFYLVRTGLAVDSLGQPIISGLSFARSFPQNITRQSWWGSSQCSYAARLNSNGSTLLDLVALGNWNNQEYSTVAHLSSNTIILGGSTSFAPRPPFLPTTGGVANQYQGNSFDAFLSRISFPATPPLNDNRAAARSVSGLAFTDAADNTGATAEAGEPAHAGQPAARSAWWKWTAPANGFLALDTSGSGFDTRLAAYELQAPSTLLLRGQNDNQAPFNEWSYIKFSVVSGREYFVAVDGVNGSQGTVMLTFVFSSAPNDDFASAIEISGYPLKTSGFNHNSSAELGEPFHLLYGRNSVWWKWVAPVSEGVSVSATADGFNSLVGVYTGSLPGTLNTEATGQVGVTFLAQAGRTYFIAVDSLYEQTADFELEISRGVPPVNDNFAEAAPLDGFAAGYDGTNLNATQQLGEENLSLLANQGGKTVWHSWISPTNGWAVIDLNGSLYDTHLSVFRGANLNSLVLVAENDNWFLPPNYASRVFFKTDTDTLYYIRVDTSAWSASGAYQLNLTLTQPPTILPATARINPDGSYTFEVEGIPGRSYLAETSTDLQTWTNISTQSQSGRFTVTFPNTAASHRFFRVQEQ